MAKKEKTKKENVKNKKSFFKDFKAELKRVIWPTRKQLINNTTAVISIVLITGAIVFALDFVFETANNFAVKQVTNIHNSIEVKNNENQEQNEQKNEEEKAEESKPEESKENSETENKNN